MQIEVNVTPRSAQGTSASRRLRRAGKVPAIVYGGGSAATAVELDHNDIYHKLKQEVFHSSILTLNLNGAKEQVLLRDVQMHAFKPIVLHVDFQRVSQSEKIHVKVPLHFVNADVAPGVKLSGGMVSHVMNEVDVLCLPKDLPEFIEVDLAALKAGQSIHLSELKLPGSVEFVDLRHSDDKAVAIIMTRGGGAATESEGEGGEAPAAE